MPNRTFSWIFRAAVILGFAMSLSACGHFGHDEEVQDEQQVEETMDGAAEAAAEESADDAMAAEAEACPHGGGACCEHGEPHPCCEHTMGGDAQPESQPSE